MIELDGEVMLVQKFECVACGSPCRLEILTTDDKLPEHLRGNKSRLCDEHFCPCKAFPTQANWIRKE
jgi:hypothetical protein